jgi:nucleoside-diphosphate-sugar epimerase
LKHYLGPFEAYGKGTLPATPFREDQERLKLDNFYYAQEDELFAASKQNGFTWTVHRPHTIIGYAIGNAMNMGVTLAVYATICREMHMPFLFPGSGVQWNGITDTTDARLLARHLKWASTTPTAHNQAFNVVNGDVFRWSWMWGRLARWFDVEPAPFPGVGVPLETQLKDAGPVWAKIARKYSLAQSDLNVLASSWHTDADLSRPIEVLTDMSKSRKLGFLDYQATDESFFNLFATLRGRRIIP